MKQNSNQHTTSQYNISEYKRLLIIQDHKETFIMTERYTKYLISILWKDTISYAL